MADIRVTYYDGRIRTYRNIATWGIEDSFLVMREFGLEPSHGVSLSMIESWSANDAMRGEDEERIAAARAAGINVVTRAA